ncbi:head-tail connector protein [Microvirga aerilata]
MSPAVYSTNVGGEGLSRLSFGSGVPWLGSAADLASIVVRYQAGYGPRPEDVDHGHRCAMLMTIARLYANRGDGLTAEFREDRFVQSIFAPYRVWI